MNLVRMISRLSDSTHRRGHLARECDLWSRTFGGACTKMLQSSRIPFCYFYAILQDRYNAAIKAAALEGLGAYLPSRGPVMESRAYAEVVQT